MRRRPRRRRIRKLRLLALLVILGLLGTASFTFGLLTAVAAKIPQLDPATAADAGEHLRLRRERAHGARDPPRRAGADHRPVGGISPWMKHAIVAAEDKRFYEHRGVDVRGMARALWADVSNRGAVQGGSTITQQFVKNALPDEPEVDRPQALRGRARLAARAALVEGPDPDRVPEHGLLRQRRLRRRAGVRASTSTTAPRRLKPGRGGPARRRSPRTRACGTRSRTRSARRQRRNLVLSLLYAQGYLTPSQYRNCVVYPMPNPTEVRCPSTQGLAAPYFANYVKDQLVRPARPGAHVRRRAARDDDARHRPAADRARRDQVGAAALDTGPTASMVVLDAHTGAVLAMVGGENYHKSQFNLATQGERQPGSSFKPFVLATALQEQRSRRRACSTSKPGDDQRGRPALGGQQLRRRVPRADRPEQGDRLLRQLGLLAADRDRRAAQRRATRRRQLGITTPLQGYFAIGLGAEPATPLEMARAYTTFADGGNRIDGSIFGNAAARRQRDQDVDGNDAGATSVVREAGADRDQAAIVNDMLQGVVQLRAPARRRSCPAARSPARPARPRTTATRGSSATRRSSSPPSGSATPTSSCR